MNFKWKSAGGLLLGLVLLAPASFAQNDQGRDDRRDDRHEHDDRRDAGRGRDTNDYGVDRGYQDGLRHGQNDRARGASQNYRSREWQQADRGYEKSMGPRGQYKKGYRDGYVRGYEEAYNGRNGNNDDWNRNRRTPRNGYPNGGYPNSGGYPNGGYPNTGNPNNGGYLQQQAQQNGYQDGIHYGQMDRQNGHSNRPTEVKGYQDADHGYTSSLGSKSDFQRIYRQAFINGYQQGYGNGGYRR